jgi:alpha-tubulin suppressor-like RCC1 family protein
MGSPGSISNFANVGRNLISTGLLCAAMLPAASSEAQPMTEVSGGRFHSLFLKSGGGLWAVGNNTDGELGDGTTDAGNFFTNRPEQIVPSNVTAIAAGGYHSLFLKSDGSMWGMGYNDYGELGNGAYNSTNRPDEILSSNVTAIAAGEYHSLFLKNDGSLWAMGNNADGELGDGSTDGGNFFTNRPEQIVPGNVTAIAAGGHHSLFLKGDGSLWAMGYNGYGELGIGTYTGTNRPQEVLSSNVTAIAAGQYYSLFLKNGGSLWAMGDDVDGELGDGANNQTNFPEQIVASNVTAIAAGGYHSLFLKSDGSLWAMGYNGYGGLGDGTYISTNRPQQIVAGNVTTISGGRYHTLFIKNGGSLWAVGDDRAGELGNSATIDTNRPEQILGAYNQIFGQLFGGASMQLSFVGVANSNYVLDRASNLAPPNWAPQATNPAGSFGALEFTNAPLPTTNNFWRIRAQ